jgi:hypothetical protein
MTAKEAKTDSASTGKVVAVKKPTLAKITEEIEQ